ncbi:WD40 repeat domain-containing protein [Labilibacter marinus]|uniref:WD40 repeat domain-containing protein n=1 Tax=Labilibacter marinus TaxID=1477105 RepID=UPI000829D140|nr:WD40 repeat domain-containing protein [Labilibacter marinus]
MKNLFTFFAILLVATGSYAQEDEYLVKVVRESDYRTNCLDLNKDNTQLLIGGENKTVEILDLNTHKTVFQTEAHYQPLIDVKYSEVENTFYTIGDRSIKYWQVGAEKPTKIYTGTNTNITSWVCSPREDCFVASSYAKKYRYWDATELKAIKTVDTGHKKSIISIAMSSDKKYVATGALDTSIEIWENETAIKKHLLLAHSRPVSCLQFVSGNQYLISASHDGNGRLWDVQKGESVKLYLGHTKPISAIAVSPCGKYLLMASFDNTISLFNIATGDRLHNYKHHEFPVLDVVWKNNGDGFYACDKEGVITEWSVTKQVFVDYYYAKEMDAEMVESKLFVPRKKGESKDSYKSRLARANKFKNKLTEKYYLQYQELEKDQVIK